MLLVRLTDVAQTIFRKLSLQNPPLQDKANAARTYRRDTPVELEDDCRIDQHRSLSILAEPQSTARLPFAVTWATAAIAQPQILGPQ